MTIKEMIKYVVGSFVWKTIEFHKGSHGFYHSNFVVQYNHSRDKYRVKVVFVQKHSKPFQLYDKYVELQKRVTKLNIVPYESKEVAE